jgi:catechol 2,3-dioxygenase-like lactoylglutathione lyase family enzyme
MPVCLDHTIVWCRDRSVSVHFLAEILGLEVGEEIEDVFLPLRLGNAVTLDYATATDVVTPQHYAFVVGDDDFDAAFARLRAAGVAYWADPFHTQPNRTNQLHGGHGLYFADPDGHNMELLTRSGPPPGSAAATTTPTLTHAPQIDTGRTR